MKWYFTYGSEGMDFDCGWTLVEAKDRDTALAVFLSFHPRRNTPPYAGLYSEDEFKRTSMYEKDNFGRRCVEIIRVQHTLILS